MRMSYGVLLHYIIRGFFSPHTYENHKIQIENVSSAKREPHMKPGLTARCLVATLHYEDAEIVGHKAS